MNLLDIDKHTCWHIYQFQIQSQPNVFLHRATQQGNFSPTVLCGFNNLLHTVYVACKTGSNDAAMTMFVKQLIQN